MPRDSAFSPRSREQSSRTLNGWGKPPPELAEGWGKPPPEPAAQSAELASEPAATELAPPFSATQPKRPRNPWSLMIRMPSVWVSASFHVVPASRSVMITTSFGAIIHVVCVQTCSVDFVRGFGKGRALVNNAPVDAALGAALDAADVDAADVALDVVAFLRRRWMAPSDPPTLPSLGLSFSSSSASLELGLGLLGH